ncbi:MAG TPA: hypothetical protein VJX67_01360 [Blastocatellia bacterium]|nr:hypothetical protein [Blastocatellia bacterium]
MKREGLGVDLVDIFEDMLCERAVKGFRPTLYVSSFTDLECSMLMLLDEDTSWNESEEPKPTKSWAGYQVTMN